MHIIVLQMIQQTTLDWFLCRRPYWLVRIETCYIWWELNTLSADPPYFAPVIGIFLLGGIVNACLLFPTSLLLTDDFIQLQYPLNDSNLSSYSFTPSGHISSASAQHSSHNCFKEFLAKTDPAFSWLLKSLFMIDLLNMSFMCPPLHSFYFSLM